MGSGVAVQYSYVETGCFPYPLITQVSHYTDENVLLLLLSGLLGACCVAQWHSGSAGAEKPSDTVGSVPGWCALLHTWCADKPGERVPTSVEQL